jgi:hypothetical protein
MQRLYFVCASVYSRRREDRTPLEKSGANFFGRPESRGPADGVVSAWRTTRKSGSAALSRVIENRDISGHSSSRHAERSSRAAVSRCRRRLRGRPEKSTESPAESCHEFRKAKGLYGSAPRERRRSSAKYLAATRRDPQRRLFKILMEKSGPSTQQVPGKTLDEFVAQRTTHVHPMILKLYWHLCDMP